MNIQLGKMHAASFATDPKHLSFVLARYHFVARMLHGKGQVLEVGAGDCTGACIVRDVVGRLVTTDLQSKECDLRWDVRQPLGDLGYEAVYALDVLEHINLDEENTVLHNMAEVIDYNGVLIIGMPSLESQPYASELSKLHHVNCKTEAGLREVLSRHFYNVFLFGMNDSTLHTGYGPLCHYRLALCTGKR